MGLAVSLAVLLLATSAPTAELALDYDIYRNRIEPIFLKKRPGHGRCYVCHAESNNAFRLQKLSPGSKSWSEEQSQRNFQSVSALVVAQKRASCCCTHSRLRPVDSLFTPAAGNFPRRTIPTGKSSPNGSAVRTSRSFGQVAIGAMHAWRAGAASTIPARKNTKR
jgi:hypothetical protein